MFVDSRSPYEEELDIEEDRMPQVSRVGGVLTKSCYMSDETNAIWNFAYGVFYYFISFSCTAEFHEIYWSNGEQHVIPWLHLQIYRYKDLVTTNYRLPRGAVKTKLEVCKYKCSSFIHMRMQFLV